MTKESFLHKALRKGLVFCSLLFPFLSAFPGGQAGLSQAAAAEVTIYDVHSSQKSNRQWQIEYGQTFVASNADMITGVTLWAGAGGVNARVTIHRDGPDGEQVGPERTMFIPRDSSNTVTWARDEVPVTRGATYYVRALDTTGSGWYAYEDSDRYASGTLYHDKKPVASSDLWAVIKGDVTADDDATPPGDATKSKLTIHTGFTEGGSESWRFIQEAQPRVVKVLSNFGGIPEIKRLSPDTVIVARIYHQDQPKGKCYASGSCDRDPEKTAEWWFERDQDEILGYPGYVFWEGYNEPGSMSGVDTMRWYGRFDKRRLEILAEHGKKGCIGQFSTGTPPIGSDDGWQSWRAYLPAVQAAIDHGGALCLHEYGSPFIDSHFRYPDGWGYHIGRYRLVYQEVLIPTGLKVPLIITETGIDGGIPNRPVNCYPGAPANCDPAAWYPDWPADGWQGFCDFWRNHGGNSDCVAEYMDQLKWYDDLLKEDDYVLGATIFSIDIPNWDHFDLCRNQPSPCPMITELIDHVKNGEAPPPPDAKPVVKVTGVSFEPTSLTSGQVLTVRITVRNDGNATAPTSDAFPPGFTFDEGQSVPNNPPQGTFRVGVDYDGRTTGLDHPYRWGFGGPLGPGETRTITGYIKLNTPVTRNYWAGLVEEFVAWHHDRQGVTSVTVRPAPLIGNIVAASGKVYRAGTLGVDAPVYIDRSFVFTSVPSGYAGQPYILTANDDKKATSPSFLKITLTAPATVYVAYDVRASRLPGWIDASWTNTGERMKTSDTDRQVFKKDFPAGQVVLGGNAMSPMKGANSNYSVIAIRK